MRHLLTATLFAVVSGTAAAQDPVEMEVARSILASLQSLSFEKNREYCGFIGYNARGILVATPGHPGTMARCSAPFPDDLAVTASYHTHGAFDLGYFNEIPSDIDVESDHAFLLNGYVSTPGGRFWYVDGREKVTWQICGLGCLPIAPGFYKGASGTIAERYTYEELRETLGE